MNPSPPERRVSMRDIARQLGVSHVTVSMALRDNPRISVAVREKIKRFAEEAGYRPDPMLSALSSYRQSKSAKPIQASIAWINGWPNPEELRGYHEFDLYWKGAAAAAEKFGFRLEEFRLDKEYSARRLHQIFQTRGIRGMLLPPHGSLNPPWAGFPWENYSIVRFGRSLENPVTHLVTADQVTNTTVAFQAMRERGYRKIGFVTKEVDMKPRGHHFSAGFLAIREMLDKSERIPIFKVTDESAGKVAASFKKWLAANRPDAILTAYAGTRELLDGAGCRVPRDIGLAVTSILDGGADSGIDQHPEEIGRVGFLMLNSLLNDGSRGIPKIFRQNLVEGSWVDGASLPDRRPG